MMMMILILFFFGYMWDIHDIEALSNSLIGRCFLILLKCAEGRISLLLFSFY